MRMLPRERGCTATDIDDSAEADPLARREHLEAELGGDPQAELKRARGPADAEAEPGPGDEPRAPLADVEVVEDVGPPHEQRDADQRAEQGRERDVDDRHAARG